MQVDFKPNIDPNTKLMGYASWNNNAKDPEVDAPFHTMHYYFLASLYRQKYDYNGIPCKEGFQYALHKFTHSEGVFRRFPTEGSQARLEDGSLNPRFGVSEHSCFDRPENLSRDNTLPIILACGEYGEHEVLLTFIKNMLKRGSFFQNWYDTQGKRKVLPDLATPDHWSVILRAYLKARNVAGKQDNGISMLLFPFILLGDLFMVISNLLTVIHSWWEPNHAPSELGHVCRTAQAQNLMDNPVSKLARLIYVKGRRKATSGFPDKIRHIGKSAYFKLWLELTFNDVEIHNDRYIDDSAVMSGLNYFFRSPQDAPYPEYCKDIVRRIES